MKICFFNTVKSWGGGEKWHLDHALGFACAGHDVTIVSNKNSELIQRATINKMRTVAFPIHNLSFLNPFKLHALYKFFKREKFDIVVLNFSTDLKTAAFPAKRAGIPKIVYRRGSDIPIKNSFINRFLFGKCLTDVLANSKATKRSILQKNSDLFPADKIKVIYNGIDTNLTEEEKISHDIPVVGCLARLVHQKGIDILLDIAAILKNRNVNCKIKIGGDGPLKEELLQQAKNKNLSDYVEFIGFVNDSSKFMRQLDVFVLTSRWEGFGYVLAETMLAKNPIVAFDVSSNPELVFDETNGYLIPFNNNEAFADAIQKLIAQPNTRKTFGDAGYTIVKEKFDFEKNKNLVIQYLTAN